MIRSEELFTKYPGDKGTRYYKYVPTHVAPVGTVLFLHGKGEIGTDIKKVEANELPKALAVDGVRVGLELPFTVVAPQEEPGSEWYSRAITAVEIAQSMNLGKPHFTGLSLGAMALDNILREMGDVFASAALVAGGYEYDFKQTTVDALKKIPTIHYYGTADHVIAYGYESTQDLVAKLRSLGADAEFIEYQDRGHDIWPEAYAHYAGWLARFVNGIPAPVKDAVIESWIEGANVHHKGASGKIVIVSGE